GYVVQDESDATLATRNERNPHNLCTPILSILLRRPAKILKHPPFRIIRQTSQNSDLVPALNQLFGEIVDAHVLRPEILTDNQNFQLFIRHAKTQSFRFQTLRMT